MIKKVIFATAIALFATAASASNVFNKLDVDANGSLNKKEATYMPGLGNQWDALDTDANGELSANEFAKYKTGEAASSQAVEMKSKPSASN